MELLVVMTIIVALLSVGAVALQALLSRKKVKLCEQSIVSALRWARHHAVSNCTECMVEIVAINDNPAARPLPPLTPYASSVEGPRDRLRVIPFQGIRDPGTGARSFALRPGALKDMELPAEIVFDDERGGRRFYPANTAVPTDYDEDGVPDGTPAMKIFFSFLPDGACRSQSSHAAGRDAHVIRLRDTATGDTATLAIMPATGSVLVR